MLETNCYSAALSFLEHESLEDSLMAVLDRHGIKMGPNTRTLEVCYASELEAAYLNVELDSALLLFVDRRYAPSGEPLFISRQVYCTERLKFYL